MIQGKKIHIFFYYCFTGLCICLWGNVLAQKSLRGKVVDDNNRPISNVQVSVNGSDYTPTDIDGTFALSLGDAPTPQNVRAQKTGFVLKEWRYQGGELKMVMSPPKKIRGKVYSNVVKNRRIPVEGINVLLIGVRDLRAAKTNESGDFSFEIPQSFMVNENSQFAVFDPGRLKSQADYDLKIGEDGLIYLFVNIPPRPVRQVRVFNHDKQGIKNTKIEIDGAGLETDDTGECKHLEHVNDFSNFRVEGHKITRFEYIDASSTMNIEVAALATGSAEPEIQPANTVDLIKESIQAEREFINNRLSEAEEELRRKKAILESGKNISTEERRKLEADIRLLEAQINRDKENLEIAKEKALNAIQELENTFSTQLDEKQKELEKTQAEKRAVELEKQLAQEQFNRNILIFSIVGVALLLIAVILVINNRKITAQKTQLAEKVEEINIKNNILETSSKMMDAKNRQIKEKNDQLTQQTRELEEKNTKITDSLRYASTIQHSILPNLEHHKTALHEYFLFFEPKDIVSGDFYWCTQKGDEFILAVADCTGHGVPGAFMTMMGNTLLNNIVNEDNVTDPAKILSLLNTSVQNTLKQQQDEEELREGDGMDVVLINYNLKIRFVTYAGAKNTLFYTKNNEIITLRGTNISIGSTLSKRENVFENHIIYLDGGETFYLTTDGFQDQLGGGEGENTRRRKYMKSRFMEFLLKISTLPISEQSLTIREEFNTFKGSHIQTDDVTVLGFRVV